MVRDLIFISYSRKDSKWLEEFREMFNPLERNLPIEVWDDTKIELGNKWKPEIERALARAYVAVLLVTKHFLSSDFIAQHELPPLLQAAEEGGLTVVLLHIKHCVYEVTEIEKYQAVNDPKQPLALLSPAKRDEVLAGICREIKKLALYNKEIVDS